MQATPSASGSRNRSLLMTLIMIAGALSPILATAADETGGQGNTNNNPPVLDCEGYFADYNDSVWIECKGPPGSGGVGEYHIQWILEDRRFVEFYSAQNKPVPDGAQEMASGEVMNTSSSSVCTTDTTDGGLNYSSVCDWTVDFGDDSANVELLWTTYMIDADGNDLESTWEEGRKNMRINHGQPTVEIMAFQDNLENWNISFMSNYLPMAADAITPPEDYNIKVWVFNPQDISAELDGQGVIQFENVDEDDDSLLVDDITNSSVYDMWYSEFEDQPWAAYAVLGNASGVLAWNVATGGEKHHGPDMEDNNRYGDATLQVDMNDLPAACENGWFKVGLIEMRLNDWGGVDRNWVYEKDIDWDGSTTPVFDDAPKGRYGVEVVVHCDENSNRAEYHGTYDWMHKWDWENESTVELKDDQTTIVTVDMYKTGMHGNTDISLIAELPGGYAFSMMENIHWSHEKECAWFDDWDNGMNETGMYWCSWEGTPSKQNNQSSWWYWCEADTNNRGYHCTDDLGRADSETSGPPLPSSNRCRWVEVTLTDEWMEDRKEMEMSSVTSFGWGMDYNTDGTNDAGEATSIEGNFGHAIVGEWAYIARVGCIDSANQMGPSETHEQWTELVQFGNLTIVENDAWDASVANRITIEFTEDDIWEWDYHQDDDRKEKEIDLKDYGLSDGEPSHVEVVYDGWGVELNMEMEISPSIRAAIDNKLNADGFLDEYEIEYELWNLVNFEDFSHHSEGEWTSTYMCSDGITEIPAKFVNDRFDDCPDGSDEGDAFDETMMKEDYISEDRDEVTVCFKEILSEGCEEGQTYYSYGEWLNYDIRDFYGPTDKGSIWITSYQRYDPDLTTVGPVIATTDGDSLGEPLRGSTVEFTWSDVEIESNINIEIIGYGGWMPSTASFDTSWSEPDPCNNEGPARIGILTPGSTYVKIGYEYRGYDNHDDGPPWHTSDDENIWVHVEFEEGTIVAAGGSVQETTLRKFVDTCFGNNDGTVTQNEVDDFASEYGWMFESETERDYNDDYNEFECKDGKMIPWDWVGDGYDDCNDGEDERYEEFEQDVEPEREFQCKDGKMVRFRDINDNKLDCDDGSDETMRDATGETVNTFTCRDGTVIKFDRVNNGYDDCKGGEDEGRKIGEDNTECYTEGDLDTDCDGFPDMRDDCPRTPGNNQGCHGEGATFVCHASPGDPSSEEQKIPWYKINDGNVDCGDGSDEARDDDGDGESDSWHMCSDGEQIDFRYVNDGYQDCEDGSDEGRTRDDNAPDGHTGEEKGPTWTCPNGETIPFEMLNNGIRDCENGADEPIDIDGDGTADNRFRCGDENNTNVSMELVNNGIDDCSNGRDEGKQEYQVDSDGDGIDDGQDHCPYEEGMASNGGCPPGDKNDHNNSQANDSGRQADNPDDETGTNGDGDKSDDGLDNNIATEEECDREGGEWHSGEIGEDGEVYGDHCHLDEGDDDDECPWYDDKSPCHAPECDGDDITPECQRLIDEYCANMKDDPACIFLADDRCRGAVNSDDDPSMECIRLMEDVCELAPADDLMCMMIREGGDGPGDSSNIDGGLHDQNSWTPCGPAWMIMKPPKPGTDPRMDEVLFMECADQFDFIFSLDTSGNEVKGPLALLGPVSESVFQAHAQIWVADYVRHLVDFSDEATLTGMNLALVIPAGDGDSKYEDASEMDDVKLTSEGVVISAVHIVSASKEDGETHMRPTTGAFKIQVPGDIETAVILLRFNSMDELLRPEEKPDQYDTWEIETDGKVDMDGDNAPDGQICYAADGVPIGYTTKLETTIEEVSGITVKTETWNCATEWVTQLARTDFLPGEDTTNTTTETGSAPACSLKVAGQGIDQVLPATTAVVGPFFVPELIDIPFSVICTPTDGSLDSAQVIVDGGTPFNQDNIASFEASGIVKGMNASQSKTVVITWTDGDLTATYTVSFTGNASEAVATSVASTDADAGFVPGFPIALTVAAFLGAIIVSSRRDEDEEA